MKLTYFAFEEKDMNAHKLRKDYRKRRKKPEV